MDSVTQKTSQQSRLSGAGLFAIILFLISIWFFMGLLFGVAFGGSKWILLYSLVPLIGSIGLFARKKWSLLFIAPVALYPGFITLSNIFKGTANDLNGMLLFIVLAPIGCFIYLCANYKKLK